MAASASTPTSSASIARQIAEAVRDGVQVAVVIGGGNFFRGAELQQRGMDRARADYMGMLGTVMNCLALQDFLEKAGHRDAGADRDHDGPGRRAVHPAPGDPAPGEGPRRHLRRRRSACRTSPPTPSPPSARWRSAPTCVLMAKNGVDGVYDADPQHQPRRPSSSTTITYAEALRRGLKVVDATAFSLCMDNTLPMVVFGMEPRATSPAPCAVRRSARWSTPIDRRARRSPTADADREHEEPTVIDETLFEAEEKMDKAVEVAKEDFAAIRTGRANPAMFNKLTVDYYGAPTPLQQLASFQRPEARTILDHARTTSRRWARSRRRSATPTSA